MLTEEEFFDGETSKHIAKVKNFMLQVVYALSNKAMMHDLSKFSEEEKSIFIEYTPKLKKSTYGSDEYKGFLKGMKPALDHHYSENRHHPEHFKKGIKDMTLLDIMEMLCDWKAATLRHENGDIYKSIELNQDRFKYTDEFKQILINTAERLSY